MIDEDKMMAHLHRANQVRDCLDRWHRNTPRQVQAKPTLLAKLLRWLGVRHD